MPCSKTALTWSAIGFPDPVLRLWAGCRNHARDRRRAGAARFVRLNLEPHADRTARGPRVRREYPSADQVGDVLIFDVLGGNFRLMTRVKYNLQRIYVKALLNHREYDRKEWMKWA